MDGELGVEGEREPDRRAGATLYSLAQGEQSRSTDTSKGLPMIQIFTRQAHSGEEGLRSSQEVQSARQDHDQQGARIGTSTLTAQLRQAPRDISQNKCSFHSRKQWLQFLAHSFFPAT